MKKWLKFTMFALSVASSFLGIIETREARKSMKNEITEEVLKTLAKKD